MVGLLNRFFEIVVDTVEGEGGLVNKFEGDAALCVFGARPTTPTRPGPRCGPRAASATPSPRPARSTSGSAWRRARVGRSGRAASRLEYTVIGDPVNEAARLTELAKDHAGRAVASEATVLAAAPGEREHWERGVEVELRGRGEDRDGHARSEARGEQWAGCLVPGSDQASGAT